MCRSAVWMIAFALGYAGTTAAEPTRATGKILSAFFGLDDSRRLRLRTFLACNGNSSRDGMPVILSNEIDDTTLDASDFQITSESGKVGRVDCVTLRPADERGEKRTVLVIGDYGSVDDQPATVKVVGDLVSQDGGVNFKGAQAPVIPLEAGPTLILAQSISESDWRLGTRGNCPRIGIKRVVRVTWTGGITKPGGAEIDAAEQALYRVRMRQSDGAVVSVAPVAVADLNDNDNNHELCLDVDAEPLSVVFPAGHLTDPNEDLNPDTEVKISAAGQTAAGVQEHRN